MKIAFQQFNLNKKSKDKLAKVIKVVEEYQERNLKLTLRQVYYQMVARGYIDNNIKEYNKIGDIVKKGRLMGKLDWNSIEDRTRSPKRPYWVHDIEDAIRDTVNHFRIDRQLGQDNYIELWVEKDAISNILYQKTSFYGVQLMVNRGYSSTTAMYNSFNRFKSASNRNKKLILLYLGDHDPSGLDMIRDIQDRLKLFGVTLEVEHIGLTREQIEEFDPPPYPAKIKDPRAAEYMSLHGNTAWEVDALPPDILHEIIKEKIESHLDMELFEEVLEKEKIQRREITKLPQLKVLTEELAGEWRQYESVKNIPDEETTSEELIIMIKENEENKQEFESKLEDLIELINKEDEE